MRADTKIRALTMAQITLEWFMREHKTLFMSLCSAPSVASKISPTKEHSCTVQLKSPPLPTLWNTSLSLHQISTHHFSSDSLASCFDYTTFLLPPDNHSSSTSLLSQVVHSQPFPRHPAVLPLEDLVQWAIHTSVLMKCTHFC